MGIGKGVGIGVGGGVGDGDGEGVGGDGPGAPQVPHDLGQFFKSFLLNDQPVQPMFFLAHSEQPTLKKAIL